MIYGTQKSSNPDVSAIIQNSNLYVYCMNNPLFFKDSAGTEALGDRDAYLKGFISKDAYDALVYLGKIHEEHANDPVVKNAVRKEAVRIRRAFDPNYIDNYDYTYGGTYDPAKNTKRVEIGYEKVSNGTATGANFVKNVGMSMVVAAATKNTNAAVAVLAGGISAPDVDDGLYVSVKVSQRGKVRVRGIVTDAFVYRKEIIRGTDGSAMNGWWEWDAATSVEVIARYRIGEMNHGKRLYI